MSKLLFATAPGCPYCVQAKRILKKLGIKYTEKKILTDTDWDWLEEKMGSDDVGVPQLFLKGKHIGGLEKLTVLAKRRLSNPKAKLAARKRGKEDALLVWNKTKGYVELEGPRQLVNDLLATHMISRHIRGSEPWSKLLVWKQPDKRKFFYLIEVPVREWRLPGWKITCLKASCRVFSSGKRAGMPIPTISIF